VDIATIVGLGGGATLLLLAIVTGGDLMLFINVPSILIVLGGTCAAVLLRYSIPEFIGIATIAKNAFFINSKSQTEVITQFIQLSQIARKEGLLALERIQFEDPFLAKGINYCVDGAETHQIESILMKDIQYMKARHASGIAMLMAVNQSAPAFGMIGTLIGLVQMLAGMDDPKSIGPSMAVAILTTLYGAVVSNLLATPVADKLQIRSDNEVDLKLLMVEGILGLKKGENPRMLEETLHTFLSPKEREALKSAA
jgi:chemotaxis protein MotA